MAQPNSGGGNIKSKQIDHRSVSRSRVDANRKVDVRCSFVFGVFPAPDTIAPMRTRAAVALVVAAFVFGVAIAACVGLFFLHRPQSPSVANTATVIQQIQSLSELVTVKYVMQKVVIFTNASTTTLGQLPSVMKLPGFDEDRIMLLAHAVVKAGVDLSQLKREDIQSSAGMISIRLPRPVVMDGYLDETKTQVLDRKAGLFRSFDKTLEQQARQYARSEMIRAARQDGIEREADERAREQLQRLMQSLGFTNIEFKARSVK